MQLERQPLRLTSPGGIDGKVGTAQITMQHDLRFVVNTVLQQSSSLQNLRASESTASRPPNRSVLWSISCTPRVYFVVTLVCV